MVLISLFWIALGLLVYTYIGYPLALACRRAPSRKSTPVTAWPTVTVVVAAYNEAHCIAEKIQNILTHDYSPDQLDVVIVSDGSTDRTNEIVQALENSQVTLVIQPQRQGKNAALNCGVSAARGEIVVFTDANALLTPGALRQLVRPFATPQVGLVSGQGYYGGLGDSSTQVASNAYVRYEAFIKQHESSRGFIAAADGALYAMRRALYSDLPITHVHDLLHPIQITQAGYCSMFVPAAFTVEPPSQNASSEYRRHLRISAQGYLVFLDQLPRLLAQGHFKSCWMLISHRFLRWISALFLLTTLVTAIQLAPTSPIYAICLGAQLAFYTCAMGGILAEHYQLRLRLLALPYFFCVVSLAGIGGFVSYLRGRRQIIWTPSGATP